jgi:hypothetical protein
MFILTKTGKPDFIQMINSLYNNKIAFLFQKYLKR